MRRILLATVLLAVLSPLCRAQLDTLAYTDGYLDSLDVKTISGKEINDYSLLGVNYGVTFSTI